jgi:phage tail-like protein
MAQFSVNPHRFDPYKQFKFRVKWDSQYIAGVTRVSALRRRTDVVDHREGGDPSIVRKSPGQTTYDPIVLERGRTHDPAFEEWATKVWNLGGSPEVSLADFRKDIIIDLFNETGQKVMSFKVYRCWPSEYVSLGELDANDTCVAFESVTLQHEGWERDYEVTEPAEPRSTKPKKRQQD